MPKKKIVRKRNYIKSGHPNRQQPDAKQSSGSSPCQQRLVVAHISRYFVSAESGHIASLVPMKMPKIPILRTELPSCTRGRKRLVQLGFHEDISVTLWVLFEVRPFYPMGLIITPKIRKGKKQGSRIYTGIIRPKSLKRTSSFPQETTVSSDKCVRTLHLLLTDQTFAICACNPMATTDTLAQNATGISFCLDIIQILPFLSLFARILSRFCDFFLFL